MTIKYDDQGFQLRIKKERNKIKKQNGGRENKKEINKRIKE